MKKFLICSIVLIVALFLGFTAYYIVANKEYIALADETSTTIKMNKGEELSLYSVIKHTSAHKNTIINIDISNSEVLQYNTTEKKFIAKEIGNAVVTITPSNTKFGPFVLMATVGDGSSASYPYFIRTVSELKAVQPTMSYELLNDLYLTELWTPLISSPDGYTGTFNGANHVIYDMRVEGNINCGGLFNMIGQAGVVKNVKMINAKISGSFNNAGIIAGQNYGLIVLCDVKDSTITNGGKNTGLIVGENKATKIVSGDKVVGAVSGRVAMCGATNSSMTAAQNAGGIVGSNNGSIIENCYAYLNSFSGSGSNSAYFGGITGENLEFDAHTKYATIYKCHATVLEIQEMERTHVSGIAAQNSSTGVFVYNYYNLDTTNLAGTSTSYTNSQIQKVTADELKEQTTYATWDFNKIWIMSTNYAVIDYNMAYSTNISETVIIETGGDEPVIPVDPDDPPVDPDDPPVDPEEPEAPVKDYNYITQANFWYLMAYIHQHPNTGKTYYFASQINVDYRDNQYDSFPLGTISQPFTCKFVTTSGASSCRIIVNNFQLSNKSYGSFFGYMGVGASVCNMSFVSATVSGNGSIGIIAGELCSGATLTNCIVKSGNVSGNGNLGAIVGTNGGMVKNCQVSSPTINLTGSAMAGMIAGINNSSISSCTVSSSELSSNADNVYAGAVCGQNSGSISSITSNSNTINLSLNKATTYAGGLVGINSGSISSSKSLPNSVNGYYAGGLTALNTGSISKCVAGQNNSGNVKGVYSGGLTSINQTSSAYISDCVVGLTMVGVANSQKVCGFAYKLESGSVIQNCFTYAKFSGNGEKYADTDTPYRNWFSSSIWQNTPIGYSMGSLENCLIYNPSNAEVQGYGVGIDLINNPLISKYDIVLSFEEATGQKGNFDKFYENNFNFGIWKFVVGQLPTLK